MKRDPPSPLAEVLRVRVGSKERARSSKKMTRYDWEPHVPRYLEAPGTYMSYFSMALIWIHVVARRAQSYLSNT